MPARFLDGAVDELTIYDRALDTSEISSIYHAGSYGKCKPPLFTSVDDSVVTDYGSNTGVAWGDYDNDGDPDLYLSKYGEPNKLFENDNGVFVDVTTSPLDDAGFGRGVDREAEGRIQRAVRQVDGRSRRQFAGGTLVGRVLRVQRQVLVLAESSDSQNTEQKDDDEQFYQSETLL